MAVPPLGATGLDTSDPATFAAGRGQLAPSSMGASEGFRDAVSAVADDRPQDVEADDDGSRLDDATALRLLHDASSQSRSFFESNVHAPWQRSYRAVRNEHFSGSLYLSDAFKTRSKIFKPKTRSALRKRLATTAKAMFTPGGVVSVQAEDDTNVQQMGAAALKQEILNYRLSTSTLRNGIPWFLIAIGARFDAEVTSICCSKQFWNYKEVETGEMEAVDGVDDDGQPTRTMQPKVNVLIDKPDIMLFPPENVRFDPNCNWTNVAQLSPYLLLQYPMTPDEAWDMIQQNKRSRRTPWRAEVTRDRLKSGAGNGTPTETTGPRSAREGGRDPKQQASGAFQPVWLTEVFMRYQGRDYTYWALNDSTILSDPVPTEQVHPWCYGERPVTIGMGQLEPHRTYQMSAVESWQQTQAEVNDLANLRLDYEKRIVSPPMKFLRGKKIDLQQLQRRGPHSLIGLNDLADVEMMEMPDVPPSAFNEASMLNADMDDLAGNFDASSVQTNRDLNETVGGMHLLSEAGNQVSDFDLSVWSETWAQPTILQLLKLEEYYETDAKVLAICGQRAGLWEHFGVDAVTDEFLRSETTVKVNLGIGATSLPMERLKRFSVAWDTSAKALAPFVQTGKIDVVPNAEEIVNDIFSAANFRDGGKRYFQYIGPPQQPAQPPPPDPKAQAALLAAQAKMQGNQIAQEKNQATALIQARKLNDDQTMTRMKVAADAMGNRTALDIAHMKAMAEMERAQRAESHAAALSGHDHAHAHMSEMMSPFLEALKARLAPQPAPAGSAKPTGPHGDPTRPQLAPVPSPHVQPQPGMYSTL